MAPIDVTILKVTDPSHFWAKEVPGRSMTSQAREFIRLCEAIDEHCNSEKFLNMHMYNPKKGMVCLVMKMQSEHWYRARVTSIIVRKHLPEASCFLLDYGETIRVPTNRLRDIPSKFLDLPFQAREYCLYGIVPLSLKVSFEDNEAKMKPAAKWDTAAVEYFDELLADKPAKVDIHHKRKDNISLVTLYVNVDQRQVNVNEELLRLQFATGMDDPLAFETPDTTAPERGASSGKSSVSSSPQSSPPRSTSPGRGPKIDRSATRRSPLEPRCKDESVSSGAEARGGKARNHGITLLNYGESPMQRLMEQDQLTSPTSRASPVPFADGKQITPIRKMESSVSVENSNCTEIPSEKLRFASQVASMKTNHVKQNSHEGQRASSSSPGQLLARLQAAVENAKKSSASPEALSPSQLAQSQHRQTPTATSEQAPTQTHRQKSPHPHVQKQTVGNASSPTVAKPPPTGTPRLKSHSLPLAQPTLTTAPTATRLPFAVGGKFSLLPEELESIAPGKSLSPPKTLQSPRKPEQRKSRQGDVSSDPDYYNSSSDDPTQYITPVMPPVKVIGQRLLKQITPAGVPLASERERLLYSEIERTSRVLVQGDKPPRPIMHIDQSPFPEYILKKLFKLDFPGPSDIQAYSWPVILRGTDMVGISAPGTGKSLAFLLPLITHSLQPSTYSSLPPGNGVLANYSALFQPLVVIVSPRWHKAAQVYDQCQQFLPTQGSKVLLIHGAGSEEQQEVQLLNGCSILVATLPCLLRMLRNDHTSLNRLSHLVLDDADVLCEDYTEKVKELMSEYASILSSTHAQRTAPRQLLLFSSQWTMALGSFVRTYMSNPVMVIVSPLEAGVYARVKQIVRRVELNERATLLRSLLEPGPQDTRQIVVFTNSRDEAKKLQQLLLSGCSLYTLLAFKGMPQDHLEAVKKEWHSHHRRGSFPILVCTDDVILDLGFTDADTVVHFDFPRSKQKFGQRLSCMMDHYASQIETKSVSDCQSILLISKGDKLHIPGLVNLLKRSGFAIPAQMQVEEAIMEKEENKKTKPLCHQLKAFGQCRNESSCAGRHQMFSDSDTPGCHANHTCLPPSGVVKILITHIVDATTFYARILECRKNEASDPVAMPATHLDLAFELASWFGDPDRRVTCGSPVAGDLCGIEDGRHVFHRVRVQRSKRAGSALFEEEKEVQYVDQGKVERVPVSKLLRLPDHLHSKPYQAVEIHVCRVKPVDGDTEWTTQAGFFVHDKIHDKQMEGKIVLSLGNTLWLDPLVQRVHLPSIKTTVNIHNVRKELLNGGFAEDNPDHIINLRKRCEGRVSLPDIVVPSGQASGSQPVLLPDPIYLSVSDDFYTVYVSSVHTPGCLYIQLSNYTTRLEKLMEEINTKLASGKTAPSAPKNWQPKVGEVCLAKFHEDERWNRVSILDIPTAGKYEVFYLDYGDQEEVTRDWLHPAWNNILKLPFQAIQCNLTNISPPQDEWSDDAGDALWEMCLGGDNKKLLMAKVVAEVQQESDTRPSGSCHYEIELYDTSSEQDVVIGHQLVHAGYADGNEAFIQTMFPTSVSEDTAKDSSAAVDKLLSQLCLQLYQTKNETEQLEFAAQIGEFISTVSQMECSSEMDITPLCHLIASGRGHQQVTDSLTARLALACFKSPKNCETVCRKGGLKELSQLLLKTKDTQLQESISYILMLSSGYPKSIHDYGGLQALCQLLEKPANADILNQASIALGELVTNNSKNQHAVNEAGGLKAICKLLSTVKNEDCVMNLLRALSKMAANGGTRDAIREEGGLLVLCDLLWETKDSRVVHVIAQALTALSCNNPSNLEVMTDQSLLDCVESQLMCTSHSQTTQQLLAKLQIRLIHYSKVIAGQSNSSGSSRPDYQLQPYQLPSTSQSSARVVTPGQSRVTSVQEVGEEDDLADMPPLEVISEHALPRSQPKVLWSQRPNAVILSVQLRGVSTFDLHVTSTSVSFSTILDGTNYTFSLDLYGRVRAPQHAATAVGSEVLITLYKESVGTKWSRLTSSKTKHAFIGTDFERMNMQDSDSEEDSSHRFGIKKKTQPVRPKTKRTQSSANPPIAPVPELDTSESSETNSEAVLSSDEDDQFCYASDHSDPLEYLQSS